MMSGRPQLRRGVGLFRGSPEGACCSASFQGLLSEPENPEAHGIPRSWKITLGITFTLIFLLIGLRNQQWLQEAEFSQTSRQLYAAVAEFGSRLYNYQARLRMPKEHLELLKKESQTLENNFREILFLIEQINALKVLLRELQEGAHNRSWRAAQDQDGAADPDEEMSHLVNYVLKKLREDQVQMADYALKSAGASIIESGTSESYKNDKAKLYWHGIGFLNYEMPPDVILQDQHHRHHHPRRHWHCFSHYHQPTACATVTQSPPHHHDHRCYRDPHIRHHWHHHCGDHFLCRRRPRQPPPHSAPTTILTPHTSLFTRNTAPPGSSQPRQRHRRTCL
nr:SUN domain-containing protein 3 isoform X2 [Oryctolagus cuniculus]